MRDTAAANATFATVAGLFTVELTSVPTASSSGGFVYRFSPVFGTVERASDSFGPVFSERALRNGHGHCARVALQRASYTTLQARTALLPVVAAEATTPPRCRSWRQESLRSVPFPGCGC